jgi:hypothetical protein
MDRPANKQHCQAQNSIPALPVEPGQASGRDQWAWVRILIWFICLLYFIGYQYRSHYVSPGAVLVYSGVKSSYKANWTSKLDYDILATIEQTGPGQLELLISRPPGENESRTLLPYYDSASQFYPELIIALDRVFLVDSAGYLHCHDLQGTQLWQLPNSSLGYDYPWDTPSVVNRGQLLVVQPGWLVAMDRDANVLWKHRRSGHSATICTEPDCQYIYFQTEEGVDILSSDGELLAHSEAVIPYLPQFAFTHDGAVLYARGPDYKNERTVSMLRPDGSTHNLLDIPVADFPDSKSRSIHVIQIIDRERFMLASDAGLYICELQGTAKRIRDLPCRTARYCPINNVIAWEPELSSSMSIFSPSKPSSIFLTDPDGTDRQEYVKRYWGCQQFSEDATGRIYLKDYHGNVRRLDY